MINDNREPESKQMLDSLGQEWQKWQLDFMVPIMDDFAPAIGDTALKTVIDDYLM